MSLFRKAKPQATDTAAPAASRGATIRLKVMRPEKFTDAPLVADELIMGRTVVLNLEAMEREACRHLLDFISGVTYALDGSIKRISGNATFIVTPTSVALCDADTDAAEEALQASPVPGTAPRTAAATDPVAAMFSGADEDPET